MHNIKIGIKLMASFAIITALTVFMGIYSFTELRNLDKNGKIIYEKATIPLGLLVQVADLAQEMQLQIREWHIAKTDEERHAAIEALDEANANIKKLIVELRARVIVEGGKKVLDNLVVAADKYVEEAHNCAKIHSIRMEHGIHEVNFPQSLRDAGTELKKNINATIEIRVSNAGILSEVNSQVINRSMKIVLVILIVAGIVSISLGVYLTLFIIGILKIVVRTISKMEDGDMTVRTGLKREDEFGMLSKSIDSLAFKLQDIIIGLRMDSDNLASSAEELSTISNQLVNIAETNLQQSVTVISTTEQVLAGINKMVKDAEKASVNSDEAAIEMEQVSADVKTMANIVENDSNSLRMAASIAKQMSANMNFIVNSIKEMKTNVDQIMGNVKAARKTVGDAIILSSEVAKAMDTDEAVIAVNNVSGIIVKIKESVDSIFNLASQHTLESDGVAMNVELADTDIKRVAEYVSQIAKNGREINSNISKVSNYIELISQSVNEVANRSKNIAHRAEIASKGTKLVNYNAIDMNQDAKSNVLGARQVSKNANELARIASNLKNVVDRFRV
jgi:methyl-accepting chemotaxis protein